MIIDIVFLVSLISFFLFFNISLKKNTFEALLIILPIQKINYNAAGFSMGFEMSILFFFIVYLGIVIKQYDYYLINRKFKNLIILTFAFILLIWFSNIFNIYELFENERMVYSFFHLIRATIIFLFVLFIINNSINRNIDVKILRKIIIFYAAWLIIFIIIKSEDHVGYDPISGTIRVSGYFANSTTASVYFIVLYCLLLIHSSKEYIQNIFITVIIAIILYFTGSKLSMILFLLIICYKLYESMQKLKFIRVVLILLIGIASITKLLQFDRFSYIIEQLKSGKSLAETTEGIRFQLWERGIGAFSEAPFFGHGYFSSRFSNMEVRGQIFKTFHSYYIDIAYGSGIFALFIILCIFIYSFVYVQKKHRIYVFIFFLMNITENFFIQVIPLLVFYHIVFNSINQKNVYA